VCGVTVHIDVLELQRFSLGSGTMTEKTDEMVAEAKLDRVDELMDEIDELSAEIDRKMKRVEELIDEAEGLNK
jgi:prefoldin subunit 5